MDFDPTQWSAKILIIGSAGVGKSSLLLKYCNPEANRIPKPTIGIDTGVKDVKVGAQGAYTLKLHCWDTAGQERFHMLCTSYYQGSHGAMIVFDVTARKSFTDIQKWLKSLKEHTEPGIPRIIIANKCDVGGDKRVVSEKEARDFARKINVPYYETSALDGTGVEVAFMVLAHQVSEKLLPARCFKQGSTGEDRTESTATNGTRTSGVKARKPSTKVSLVDPKTPKQKQNCC